MSEKGIYKLENNAHSEVKPTLRQRIKLLFRRRKRVTGMLEYNLNRHIRSEA